MAARTKGTQTPTGLAKKPDWFLRQQNAQAKRLEDKKATSDFLMSNQGFTEKEILAPGVTRYKPQQQQSLNQENEYEPRMAMDDAKKFNPSSIEEKTPRRSESLLESSYQQVMGRGAGGQPTNQPIANQQGFYGSMPALEAASMRLADAALGREMLAGEYKGSQEMGLQRLRGAQEFGLQGLRGSQEFGLQRLRGEQNSGLERLRGGGGSRIISGTSFGGGKSAPFAASRNMQSGKLSQQQSNIQDLQARLQRLRSTTPRTEGERRNLAKAMSQTESEIAGARSSYLVSSAYANA
jgi:hypothetical protein